MRACLEMDMTGSPVLLAGEQAVDWADVQRLGAQLRAFYTGYRLPRLHVRKSWYPWMDCLALLDLTRTNLLRRYPFGEYPLEYKERVAPDRRRAFSYDLARTLASAPKDRLHGVWDYGPAVTFPTDLYCNTAFVESHLVQNPHFLQDLLAHSGMGTYGFIEPSQRRPTWVEDFNATRTAFPEGIPTNQHNCSYIEANFCARGFAIDAVEGSLRLRALRCGIITHIPLWDRNRTAREPDRGSTSRFVEYVLNILQEYKKTANGSRIPFSGGMAPAEAIGRLLFHASVYESLSERSIDSPDIAVWAAMLALIWVVLDGNPAGADRPQDFCWNQGLWWAMGLQGGGVVAWMRDIFPFLPQGFPGLEPGREAGFEELVERAMAHGRQAYHVLMGARTHFRDYARSRYRFFETENNELGIGPPGMLLGDELFWCGHVDFELVMRPVGGGRYAYVGPAFVLGPERGWLHKYYDEKGQLMESEVEKAMVDLCID